MVPRLAIGGSQMQGRSLSIFYNYHHIVYGQGTYDYQMLGTTTFNKSDGSIWFTEVPMAWDEAANRVQDDKPFTINVKAFKYGSNFHWQTRIVYNRSGGGVSVETVVMGKIYGGNANAISLVGPRFSGIVDGVRFSYPQSNLVTT